MERKKMQPTHVRVLNELVSHVKNCMRIDQVKFCVVDVLKFLNLFIFKEISHLSADFKT